MLIALLMACRVATVQDLCVEQPELCPACAEDTECVYGGNNCYETVDCLHQDAEVAYPDLGCSDALTYRWPDPETCGCVEGVCRSR